MDNLEKWLDNGRSVISPKVAVEDLPGRGRGVVTKDSIKRGEILATIKRDQLLNYETIRYRADEEDMEARKRFSGIVLLTWYLYKYHNDPKNYWADFIETLPTEEDLKTMPLTWSDTDVEKNLPPRIREMLYKQRKKLQKDMELVKDTFYSNNSDFDEQLFKWAWMCVNTRCVFMNVPGAPTHNEKVTLAPFADFINHVTDKESSVNIKIDGKGLVITARQPYEANEELYLSYGAHDNAKLLIEYGFTVPSNPWDSVDISDYILPRLSPLQLEALEQQGYGGSNYTVNIEGPSFRTIIAFATSFENVYENAISNIIEIPRRLEMLQDGEGDTDMYIDFDEKLIQVLNNAKLELCEEFYHQDMPVSCKMLLEGYKYILDKAIKERTN